MTEKEVIETLQSDPTFLGLPPELQKHVIVGMLEQRAKERNEPPYELNPQTGRSYDPTTPSGALSTMAEIGGAIGGGIAGAKLAGRALQAIPLPAPKAIGFALETAGAVAGAGVGAGVVGAGRAALHRATGVPDKDIPTAARDAAIEGAVGEVTGRGVAGAVRTIPRIVAGKRVVGPEIVAAGEERGMRFTPAELSQETTPAMIQHRIERSILSSGKFQKLQEENLRIVKEWAEDLANKHFGGLEPSLTGGANIQALIRGESLKHYKDFTAHLFSKLESLPKVDTQKTADILKRLDELDEGIHQSLAPKAKALIDVARSLVGTQNPKTGTWIPRSVTFNEAHELRSTLLQIGRDHTEVLSDRVGGMAKHIANTVVWDAMEKTARSAGPGGYERWRRVDTYVKLGHQIFDDAAVVGALRARPEDVIDATLSKRSVTEIERVMAALKRANNPSEAINLYRRTAAARLIERASADGHFDPNKLYQAVYGGNGIGRDAMVAAFGKDYMKEFDLMLGAARKAQVVSTRALAGNPSETARSLIAWVEGAAILELGRTTLSDTLKGELSQYTTTYAGTIGSYILLNRGMANLLTTKRGVELLRKAMLTSPKSQEAVKLVPRLISAISGELITSE